ncbi:MAG: hypothetical protein ACSW8J_08740, partial [bacterium]
MKKIKAPVEQQKMQWTTAQIVLSVIMVLISLTCLLPFVNMVAISLSSKSAILRGDVTFWPVELDFTAYKAIFADPTMLHSLFFTVRITVVYTVLAMIFSIFASDPLFNVRRFTDAWVDFSQVTEEDWYANARTPEMLPGSKEGFRWLNTLYHDGVIPDTFALTDNDQANDTAL